MFWLIFCFFPMPSDEFVSSSYIFSATNRANEFQIVSDLSNHDEEENL